MATMRLAMTNPLWSVAYDGSFALSPTLPWLRAPKTFTTRSDVLVPLSLS